MQGRLDKFSNEQMKYGLWGLPVSVMGVAGLGVASALSAPLAVMLIANAFFAGSLTYLTGLGMGILKDVLGARKSMPYYLFGHEPYLESLVRSNDRFIVGVAWGLYDAFPAAGIGAAVAGVVACIATIAGAPLVGFGVPIAALPIVGLMLTSFFIAKRRAATRIQTDSDGQLTYVDPNGYTLDDYLKAAFNDKRRKRVYATYQRQGLKRYANSREAYNNWLMARDQNAILSDYMPFALLGSSILFILISSLGALFAPFFLMPAVALGIPLVYGGLLAVGVTSVCLYMHFNQDKQVANEYQLDWPELHNVKGKEDTLPLHVERVAVLSHDDDQSHRKHVHRRRHHNDTKPTTSSSDVSSEVQMSSSLTASQQALSAKLQRDQKRFEEAPYQQNNQAESFSGLSL